ncbi:MAG: glycoside hydrolase family 73 protein [Candidatus Riflebacteria bacterium]|nr:glycoside hydrolase family 73 protein [Candidatus Riflebacteria bacterium]
MTNRRTIALVFPLCLFLFVTAPALLAESGMQDVLDGHTPSGTTAPATPKATAAPEKPAAAAPAVAVQDPWVKIMERLAKIFERLTGIYEKLVNLIKTKKTTAAKPSATDKPGSTPPASSGKDTGALADYKGGKLSPAEFGRVFGPAARESMKLTGVPASVTLAQAALETGWGKSSIGDAKNLFGMKGTGPAGTTLVWTTEYVNGKYIRIQDKFRKYHSWRESIDDHARLLSQGSRYKKCMANKNNPDQFARELQKAGYATDPQYASKLIGIMKANNFYQYDK